MLLIVSSRYELFKETVVMSVIPAVLFWAIDHYRKETSFYFVKCVACLWIGRLVFDVICFHSDGRELMLILLFWQIMLTILLFCMKIIQMIYDRIPDKRAYFGYIVIGAALALNVSYIAREYDNFSWSAASWRGAVLEYTYVLEHGIALLIAAAVVLYQYLKRYRIKMKDSVITGRSYRYHAIEMTMVSFLILVFPLYQMLMSE